MITEIKSRFLNWYGSLTDWNRRMLAVSITVLLPALSFYAYTEQMSEKSQLMQKLSSVKTAEQIKSQMLVMEKKRLFYSQQIPELKALLINPPTDYAYNTQLNQIPIILNSEINSYGGYMIAFREGKPVEVMVDWDGSAVYQSESKFQRLGTSKQTTKEGIFELELLPVKFIITTSRDKLISFLNNFNTPDSAYPFVLIKNLSSESGKKSNCNGVVSNQNYAIASNTATATSRISICVSGYVIAGISEVQLPLKNGVENGKKH